LREDSYIARQKTHENLHRRQSPRACRGQCS
jgi:hypothetical protein